MTVTNTTITSPIGDLTLVAADGALTGVYFPGHRHGPDAGTFGERDDGVFAEAVRQLGEYFAGDRTRFDLPLAPRGDAFQQKVWMLLRDIPYGQTRNNGQQAEALGDRNLARAVGAANGRNPLSIIVPCHRVIGADGNLVGYAGGLDRKRFLLALEEPTAVTAGRLF
jgi:methylated-DNA-[protein]-cysteine S-methyltransferase